MNNEILHILKNCDDYISGEDISKHFNITRASVWKHIKILKELGYEIEGVSKKGYKLISSPDLLDINDIKNNLSTNFIGRNIEYYTSLSSTNKTAKELAANLPDGSIIISEEQVGGKGRLGRSWTSPKGGLWTSLILKPNIEPMQSTKVTQIAAASIIKVLNSKNIQTLIKWPNDIYLHSKKICGILTEMKCDMDRVHYIILGFGLNVNIDIINFDEEILKTASSLQIETNKLFDRSLLLAEILNEFEYFYSKFIDSYDLKEVITLCRENSFIINKHAYLVTSKNKERVKCIGLNDEGALIIENSKGEILPVITGEITFKE